MLLLHAEQGLGDTIQYCRYVPLAGARARVVLQVPRPLVRLLSSMGGIEAILATGDPLPPFDAHCPLLSLPGAFDTALDNIPAAIPYLAAEPTRVSRWREILGSTGFRVGIVWQVNPQSETDLRRSIPLSHFASISKNSKCPVDQPAEDARVGSARRVYPKTHKSKSSVRILIMVQTPSSTPPRSWKI